MTGLVDGSGRVIDNALVVVDNNNTLYALNLGTGAATGSGTAADRNVCDEYVK